MPRPRKTLPKPNAVIASAARVSAGRRKDRPRGSIGEPWQVEAWDMLDTVGELSFYHDWLSNAGKRCTLWVGEETIGENGEPTVVPTTYEPAHAALAALFGGEAGQAQMLGQMFGHIAIPGETWLVGLPTPPVAPDDPDQWRVLSHEEIRDMGSTWIIDRGDGVQETYKDEDVYVARIWNPHPRRAVHATSSVRAALPILRQLVGLEKHAAANIDSRLAGAGILAVPSEMTFNSPVLPDDDTTDVTMDPFLAALTEAMVTAIEDRSDASAVVPIVVRAPAEHLAAIKHITLSTPFDEKASKRTEAQVQRLANSLSVPAEVLTGMADVNHWTGWLLDENAVKMHVEPPLQVITHGLSTRYLWAVLQGNADYLDPALRKYRIMGSTANLRTRPNRSAEAQSGHERVIISDAAYAREVGFEEEDILTPDDPEWQRRMLMRVAAAGTPELAAAALNLLGIPLTLPEPPTASTPAPQAVASAPEPQAIEARRTLPQQEQMAAALAASEVLVLRAVERAWNRAGKRGRTRTPVTASVLDTAMTGVWDHAPRTAALLGFDPEAYAATLDRYTRGLLTSGADHNPQTLATLLMRDVLTRATG